MKSLIELIKESCDEFSIIDYTNTEEIKQYAQEVYDILLKSYKGNIAGASSKPKKFIKTVDKLSVISNNFKIIALSTYREVENKGYKLMYLGCDQTSKGKRALQEIIKRDINDSKSFVWCECSDVIEHWFKKYKGFPVPNTYVEEILEKNVNLCNDEFHYTRVIGSGEDADEYKKVIFGFPNKEIAEQVINEFNDYELKRFNLINENERVFKNPEFSNLEVSAMGFIDNITDINQEGVNELTQLFYDELQKAIEILKPVSDNRIVKIYLNRAAYLLDCMPLLEINQI